MDPQKVLINLGCNAKEASVYLATLELGPSPASDIAKKAGQKRVTTYDILEKLMDRGFISLQEIDGVKIFSATDPDLLRDDFRQKYMDFKAALPDLRRLHGKTPHPRVRYYEGAEAIKKIYADSLQSKTEILNYADSKLIRDFWPSYDQDYVEERVRRGIYLRGIAPMDEHGKKVACENERFHREIRLVRAGPFAFKNEINIYDDKVAIISFGSDKIIGMVIESPEIANTQRAIFMMAWEFARQVLD